MPSVQAPRRCKKAGVDVIVASGHEGGFHTSWDPVHTIVLLPAVVDAVSDANTLVVGASGFADGKSVAAAFALGADGVQMGTRFLATQESDFHPNWKQAVVEAGDRATLIARGFVGPARWLKNARSQEHAVNTLKKSPAVHRYSDDYSTTDMSLVEFEHESMERRLCRRQRKSMFAAGESAKASTICPKRPIWYRQL